MKKLILILIVFSLSLSCKRNSLSASDYVQYVKDPRNGLIVDHVAKNFKFSLQYEPLDYLTLKEIRNTKFSPEIFESTRKQFGNSIYFDFIITTLNQQDDLLKEKDSIQFNKRLNYFSFDFNQKVELIDGIDTLHCLLHHFERNYGISPENHIALAFENFKHQPGKSTNNELLFIYNDEVLQTGKITISINKKSLFEIPGLNI